MKFFRPLLFSLTVFGLSLVGFGQTTPSPTPTPAPTPTTGKVPIIVIPGITGSTLFDKRTNEEVWFRIRKPKGEDIRLPISANIAANRDNLEARDIVRGVKISKILPEIEIYERLIFALEKGGYKETSWDQPGENADKDSFYVFAYDWRRDNVENARLLVKKIEALKQKLRKPALKFNIASHSMGGLIARYAAMYGDADIPKGSIVPTWAGSKHLGEVFLIGAPNEGSILSLKAALQGYSLIGNISLPFIQSFDKFDVFTIPSIPQVLPWGTNLTIYDENFKELALDLYDPHTWEEYDWAAWKDKDFKKKFENRELPLARPFFAAVLQRAKRFHEALTASRPGSEIPVSFYLVGGDCKDTAAAAIVVFDEKKKRWETIFSPKAFTRSDGTKVTADEVKAKLNAKGDGTVALRSLMMAGAPDAERNKYLPIAGGVYQCEEHTKLVTSPKVQDELLALIQ